MESTDPTEELKRSNIFDQIELIQILRENAYLYVNRQETLTDELQKLRAITKSVLGDAILYNGKFYPKKIAPELYAFGDTFDHCVLLSHKILEKLTHNESVSNFEKEAWTFEMNVALSKYISVVGLWNSETSNSGILLKDFKSRIIIENERALRLNELASGIIAELSDSSKVIETDSNGVQLLNCLNWEKECICKEVNQEYIMECDNDVDIDDNQEYIMECDNDVDIDDNDDIYYSYTNDDDDDINEQCLSSALHSLKLSPDSSWLSNTAHDCRKASCSSTGNEWIEDYIRIRNQKSRKKQQKLHNQVVSYYKNPNMYDSHFDKEDITTRDVFDVSPQEVLQNIEKASDFERFILLELPNISSDYEPIFDEEESEKLWEAAIEEEKEKCFQQTISANKNSKAKVSTQIKKSLCIHTATQKPLLKHFSGKRHSSKLENKLNKRRKRSYKKLSAKHSYESSGLRYIKKSTATAYQ